MMRGSEASAPDALFGLSSPSILNHRDHSSTPMGFETRTRPSLPATQTSYQHAISLDHTFGTASAASTGDVLVGTMGGDSSGSTGRGILIGILSALGSAGIAVIILALFFFFRYTQRGRIILDRMGRPGEYDDEQAFLREEAEALEAMDELSRSEYLRAKGRCGPGSRAQSGDYWSEGVTPGTDGISRPAFIEANPPESMQTDISLSQFLAIQEKGVSAWEFQPELEIANCFVEARTEIEFFDSECSVQTNLPVPKQNDVYYWEAKIYDKPESTLISVGMTTKPYPLFRLPGALSRVLQDICTSRVGANRSRVQAIIRPQSRISQPGTADTTSRSRRLHMVPR